MDKTVKNMVGVVNNAIDVPVKRMISAWKSGQPRQDFESTAITWGQLKSQLMEKGFSLTNVRVSEGNTQIDLVNSDALLPTNINKRGQITNDLVIIMTPQTKIKSGMLDTKTASYKDLKAEIKELCNTSSTSGSAKAHFGNYTQMSTDNMRTTVASWYKKNGSNTPVTKSTPQDKSKLEEVKSNLENKNFEPAKPEIDWQAYNEVINLLLNGLTELQNKVFTIKGSKLPSDSELKVMAKKFK